MNIQTDTFKDRLLDLCGSKKSVVILCPVSGGIPGKIWKVFNDYIVIKTLVGEDEKQLKNIEVPFYAIHGIESDEDLEND